MIAIVQRAILLAAMAAALTVADRAGAKATDPIEAAATQVYVWGMPLVEAAMIRARFSGNADGGAGPSAINTFKHRRGLAGPEMRSGVGPNNDTIYSIAWADLSQGPLVLSAPDFGTRYYTFSINFADSSADQSLGQRTHGGQLPPLFLHGPDYRGATPAGMVDVPSPTRYINIAGRFLPRDPGDFARVNALQDQLMLVEWDDWRAGRRVPARSPPSAPVDRPDGGAGEAETFLARLALVLRDWRLASSDRRIVPALRLLGLQGSQPKAFSPRQWRAVRAGLEAGKAIVDKASLQMGRQVNGWAINYKGPRFGRDWRLRAGVARDQILVAIPEEAIYPVARADSGGHALDGRCRYRIRLQAGRLPPVDAFWSITAYGDDGFMIPNPIGRYSIGDRTAGLRRDPDGSITLLLSHEDPRDMQSNWLPTGESGFYLMMRLYRPRPDVLAGRWVPPPIERIGICPI